MVRRVADTPQQVPCVEKLGTAFKYVMGLQRHVVRFNAYMSVKFLTPLKPAPATANARDNKCHGGLLDSTHTVRRRRKQRVAERPYPHTPFFNVPPNT